MLYKIPFHCHILLVPIVFFFQSRQALAQDLTISRYGVGVIDKIAVYQQHAEKDSLKKMIELKAIIPGIIYDLRYSTTNNFMHRRMYPKNTRHTFLRIAAAEALKNVQ